MMQEHENLFNNINKLGDNFQEVSHVITSGLSDDELGAL